MKQTLRESNTPEIHAVYAHAELASVDDATFDKHWKDIRDTLVRLGGVTYEVKDF